MNSNAAVDTGLALPAEPSQHWPAFTRLGMKPLVALAQEFEDLQETLADIEAIGGESVARRTRRMGAELDAFAPAVTFIGQIKSGKTTLVNAIACRPGLLPADVNPWTSVVTSLHLGHLRKVNDPVASFTFFEETEWDHLVENGGRIGELSARAGADKEHERLVAQIAEMREKTKARLGRKFEMLLGQTHSYHSLDDGLIQRYVCLGDDFDDLAAMNRQGQFADITKSAELYFDAPNLPLPLTLRDTPGMNDTFLMREQITIRSIRESRICVVVLSAHQALNSVDMGLIRMISNVKSREVIIFINRIDELADPMAEIPEIRESLLQTLRDHNGPEDPQLIFGSAFWANNALTDTLDQMPEASRASMAAYEGTLSDGTVEDMDDLAKAWVLSGVPELFSAMGDRIAEAPGQKALAHVRRRATNIVSGLRASSSIVTLRANSDTIQKLSQAEAQALVQGIGQDARNRLEATLNELFDSFSDRVDQAHVRYTARALDALLKHLEAYGDDQVWSYSADGLRTLMRTAYQVMTVRFRRQVGAVLEQTADDLTRAYGQIFDVTPENFAVETPPIPDLPAPVSLAQTIALDVSTSMWKRWWAKRKGYRAYADDFRTLIEAETTPLVSDLKIGQIADVRAIATNLMQGFLDDQTGILNDICDKVQISIEDLHGLFGVSSQEEREELFDIIADELGITPDDTTDGANE